MKYRGALAYLDKLGNEVLDMRLGLDRIRAHLEELGRPEKTFSSVLVAGTNGKGSTARFLEGILRSSGLRTGLFTSPHLIRIEERIAVAGRSISPRRFASLISRLAETSESLPPTLRPTYFETLTAGAFLEFSRLRVDIAVLEVGLGGRLDSTNVVDPVLSLITPISLDHQQILGPTIEQIAREKAGIIHPGRDVLWLPQAPQVSVLLQDTAESRGSPYRLVDARACPRSADSRGRFRFAWKDWDLRLQCHGAQQVDNAVLAIEAALQLKQLGFALNPEGIATGVETTQQGTFRRLEGPPVLVLDGAHNPAAGQLLANYLRDYTLKPRHLVLGMMRDKDSAGFLGTLQPLFDRIILTGINSPRAANPEDLARLCPDGVEVPRVLQAIRKALPGAKTIVVTGSFYLVGEMLLEASRRKVAGIWEF